MGCNVTKTGLVVAEEKELSEYLSDEDIAIIQQTWGYIQEDIDEVGFRIFQSFFEHNKSMKKLFCTKLAKDACKNDPNFGNMVEMQFDDQKIRDHGRIVMEALGAAIESMGDSDQLTILLIGIGERHVMYGVDSDMVPLLWPPIIKTFQETLGPRFTHPVSKAWEHVFQYIGGKVIEGIARWRTKRKSRFEHY